MKTTIILLTIFILSMFITGCSTEQGSTLIPGSQKVNDPFATTTQKTVVTTKITPEQQRLKTEYEGYIASLNQDYINMISMSSKWNELIGKSNEDIKNNVNPDETGLLSFQRDFNNKKDIFKIKMDNLLTFIGQKQSDLEAMGYSPNNDKLGIQIKWEELSQKQEFYNENIRKAQSAGTGFFGFN